MTTKGTFYGHEKAGAKMAETIMRRLRMPESEVKAVSTIISEHLRPPLDPSDKALRNYVADVGECLEDALMVKYGDLAAHNLPPGFDPHAWFEKIKARTSTMTHLSGFDQKRLAISGAEIAAIFRVNGKGIGALKNAAAQAVVDGTIPNDKDAIVAFLNSVPK